MSQRRTDSACVVCGGKIVEVADQEFDASMGPMIIGPGGKNQWHDVVSYHCGSCGLVYQFLPKKKARR